MVELASRRAVSPSATGVAARALRRDDRLRRGRVHLQVPPCRPAAQDWLALQLADRRGLWPGDLCRLRLSRRRAGDRGGEAVRGSYPIRGVSVGNRLFLDPLVAGRNGRDYRLLLLWHADRHPGGCWL